MAQKKAAKKTAITKREQVSEAIGPIVEKTVE